MGILTIIFVTLCLLSLQYGLVYSTSSFASAQIQAVGNSSNPTSLHSFQNSTKYEVVKVWGSKGTNDGQFKRPHDLDFSSDEKILYSVDRDGNRIQAFDKNGTFLFKWGKLGDGDGEMHVPYGIDVDIDGNVWLADRANLTIRDIL